MAEEICPNCGSLMEIVKMDDEDILRCTSCGYERPLIEVEPWEPIEGKLIRYSLIAGIVLTIVLAALINAYILSQYS